jgi:hypothetical protein
MEYLLHQILIIETFVAKRFCVDHGKTTTGERMICGAKPSPANLRGAGTPADSPSSQDALRPSSATNRAQKASGVA